MDLKHKKKPPQEVVEYQVMDEHYQYMISRKEPLFTFASSNNFHYPTSIGTKTHKNQKLLKILIFSKIVASISKKVFQIKLLKICLQIFEQDEFEINQFLLDNFKKSIILALHENEASKSSLVQKGSNSH